MEQTTPIGPRPRLLLEGGSGSFKLSPFEIIILLAVLAIAGFIGYTLYARSTNLNSVPAAAPTYLPAFRTTLTSSVSSTGTVAATQQQTLTFASPGKITEMDAKLGDQVTKGQVLAKLDDTELQQALRSAQANLTSSNARYAASTAGPTDTDIAAAQQAILTAQNGVQSAMDSKTKAQAQLTTDQQNIATAQGAITTAQNAVQTAQTGVTTAQTNLVTAQNNIVTAQNDLTTAQADLSTKATALSYAITQVSAALSACGPVPSISTPSMPSQGGTAQTMLPLPYGFVCASDASPVATASNTPTPTPSTKLQTGLTGQMSSYNSAAGAYNTAVTAITTKQTALTTAQNGVTTATNAIQTAQNGVTTAQNGVTKAQTDLATAQTTLQTDTNTLNNGSFDRAIQNAQLGEQAAETKYNDLFTPPTLDVTAPLEASVEQAQDTVATAQQNLSNATITAPFDGQISQVTGDVNTSVTATTGVFILVNPKLIRVDASVDQADISNLKAGQTAAVTFDALAGRSYNASLTATGLNPTITQGVVTYVATFGIDTTNLAPGVPIPTPGMTASITVTTSRTDNALVVPSRAVKRVGRNSTVTVKTDTGSESRTVVTGTTNGTLIQITSGLNDGDEVLVSAPAAATSSSTKGTTTGNNTFVVPGGGGGGVGGRPGGG